MMVPKAFETPEFESLLAEYVKHILDYVGEKQPDLKDQIAEALNNNSEMLAQVVQALMLKRIAEKREDNHQAMQMFRKFVTDSDMVDLLALQYNLKRQTLKPADDSVFPPVPAVLESDEDLLRRFDLAPYQFHTTGTRTGYKFHALTLDEKPTVTLESTVNGVSMHFTFPKERQPNPVKDAEARMATPNSGEVAVAVLSRETPEGIPDAALLQRVSRYLNRDDIAQESDALTVKAATPVNYRIVATLYTGGDPNHDVSQVSAETTAQTFADDRHRLGQRIDRLKLGEVLYSLGPKRVVISEPAQDVICQWDEAPFCTEVVIDVRAE